VKRGLTEHDGPHIVNEGKDEIIGEKRTRSTQVAQKVPKEMFIGGAGTREDGKCTIMDSCHMLSGEGLPPVFNRSFRRDVLRRKKNALESIFDLSQTNRQIEDD